MHLKAIAILLFLSIFTVELSIAQQTPVKKDSTKVYKEIENYSKRRKFTKLVFSIFFKPVPTGSAKKKIKKKLYNNLIQKPYAAFEGKIIRNINITTLDPFGYSVDDTSVTRNNIFYNAGNRLHIKTKHITIVNLMLIHKNQPFNSLFVKESERLIRKQMYVHEVSFYVAFAGKTNDSVDIFIRELDVWSIIPKGSISTSSSSIDLTDNNFLGTGHSLQSAYSRDFTSNISSLNTNYHIPNIRNSHVNSTLRYELDGYRNFKRSVSVDRPFFSPLAKWAAGASIFSEYKHDSLKDINLINAPIKIKFGTQDFWVGKAVKVFRDNTEENLSTNLIFALRFLRIRYYEKPSEFSDPLHIYSSENLYLAGIGISTRKYAQDRYIFKFGRIEDVPIGKIYGLTGGYQERNNAKRLYLGLQYSFGNYFDWGYLSSNFEYGTFFNGSSPEQGVFTEGINYFTGLYEVGKWKFRQFVKPQVTIGINRFSYDSITLNDGYGLDGFNSKELSGTNRFLITLQTQTYAPWDLIGFRFGFFFNYSLGIIGDDVSGFKNSKPYSLLGFGVLIKNENMIFNTFQISISFYPVIPGKGYDIFKPNSFRSTDIGFRDFEFGKPTTVVYR
ncbi:MAG: hypothetical protein EHM93_12795 [Bacteroidales bacterium]|nr:MAG: hypothetical protein EHM93_12795 [Bacteroidales bacterium]